MDGENGWLMPLHEFILYALRCAPPLPFVFVAGHRWPLAGAAAIVRVATRKITAGRLIPLVRAPFRAKIRQWRLGRVVEWNNGGGVGDIADIRIQACYLGCCRSLENVPVHCLGLWRQSVTVC